MEELMPRIARNEVNEDREGRPSSFLPKWAAKSWGRFVFLFPFSPDPASEGPLPSTFLPILLLSMFEASSNPTTLSHCLRALGDLVQSGGVTSLTNHRDRISRTGGMISKWRVFRRSGGKYSSSYRWSFSDIGVGYMRLRWDRRVPRMLKGLPSLG
uniref:Uncharacterized protein n=1 Tax=Tanacetum cinerariifolium TaxID=118510 RepID=A0A699H1I3_TANCI|nr:hypothetical protein [Tanacetum cinerariifolium]